MEILTPSQKGVHLYFELMTLSIFSLFSLSFSLSFSPSPISLSQNLSSSTLQFSVSSDLAILRGRRLLKRRLTEFDLNMRTDFHYIFFIFIRTMSASSDRFFAM